MKVSIVVSVALAGVSWSAGALAQGRAAAACELNAAPGVSEQRLSSAGRERTYRLFVPQSYDGSASLPLAKNR